VAVPGERYNRVEVDRWSGPRPRRLARSNTVCAGWTGWPYLVVATPARRGGALAVEPEVGPPAGRRRGPRAALATPPSEPQGRVNTVLATIRRPAPARLDPQADEALDRVERAYDLDDAAIDDLTATHGPEIRRITNALDRTRLEPNLKLVLSRPRIYAKYLLQYFQDVPDPRQRSPRPSAEAVASRAAEAVDRLQRELATLGDRDRDRAKDRDGGQYPDRDRDRYRGRYRGRTAGGEPRGLRGGDYPEPSLLRDPWPCAVSDVDLTAPPAGSVLELSSDPVAVHAVKHLAHAVAFGEQLGVFPAFEALIAQWNVGAWLFYNPELNNALYCVLRRDDRMTPRERHLLAAAILGVRSNDLPAGASVNDGFPEAFQQLVQEILHVQDAECACEQGDEVNRGTVVFAVDQLRFNIDANMTGAALMRIRELAEDLENVQAILADDEVIGQVACGHHDGVLAVVNVLNGRGPSVTPNAVAISRADDARTELLRMVAEEQDFALDGVFDEAVGYATTLDAAEAWLTGRPRMARAELGRPGDGRYELAGATRQRAILDRDA
jgi:hypothetical protein